VAPGAPISAIGVYSYFHLSALQKASRLAREPQLAPAERAALARAVLADEAFALHFLQDMFAAGHIAGTWGDASQRQGTHDFYNQSGIEVSPGRGQPLVLMGDAHMRPRPGWRPAAQEAEPGAGCSPGGVAAFRTRPPRQPPRYLRRLPQQR
jgi:hypothetical protein